MTRFLNYATDGAELSIIPFQREERSVIQQHDNYCMCYTVQSGLNYQTGAIPIIIYIGSSHQGLKSTVLMISIPAISINP